MKKIVFTFDKHGGVKQEAFGYSGSACLADAKPIEDAIGKTVSRKMKTGPDGVQSEQVVTQ